MWNMAPVVADGWFGGIDPVSAGIGLVGVLLAWVALRRGKGADSKADDALALARRHIEIQEAHHAQAERERFARPELEVSIAPVGLVDGVVRGPDTVVPLEVTIANPGDADALDVGVEILLPETIRAYWSDGARGPQRSLASPEHADERLELPGGGSIEARRLRDTVACVRSDGRAHLYVRATIIDQAVVPFVARAWIAGRRDRSVESRTLLRHLGRSA